MTTEAELDLDELEGEDFVEELISEVMAEYLGPRKKNENKPAGNRRAAPAAGTARAAAPAAPAPDGNAPAGPY